MCHVLGPSTTGHAITESKVQTDHLSHAQIEVLHVTDVDILAYKLFLTPNCDGRATHGFAGHARSMMKSTCIQMIAGKKYITSV